MPSHDETMPGSARDHQSELAYQVYPTDLET